MKYAIARKEADDEKISPDNIVEKPKWQLEEVALSRDTVEQIEEMIAYVQNREKMLNEWNFNRFLKAGKGLSINFFGVPGTGKSITAEAIAARLNMNIIKANYGELESSLVGGTVENLTHIFDVAEQSNSLLLFDEADSILSKRISGPSQAADHGVNSAKSTLLTLLDKFNGVVVFTTNIFNNYDDAFLRRILFNVEFHPPDNEMRTQLWKFHLSEAVPREISYDRLSEISDQLCGGDIKNLTVKFGLRLLTGKETKINEDLVGKETQRYKEVKNQHRKRLSASPDESNFHDNSNDIETNTTANSFSN